VRHGSILAAARAFKTAVRRPASLNAMRFDTKIGIVVREDLAVWQRLNVTAFLAGGVAGGFPELIGEPYEDGSGNAYLPTFRQPVLVYAADAEGLARVHGRALARDLRVGVYTEEMFKTGNDADNRAVDKILKGLPLHP
jgi:hypothetical protein